MKYYLSFFVERSGHFTLAYNARGFAAGVELTNCLPGTEA